jgi:hypothetical protein
MRRFRKDGDEELGRKKRGSSTVTGVAAAHLPAFEQRPSFSQSGFLQDFLTRFY